MPSKRLVVCVNERLGPGQKSCAGSGSREHVETLRRLIAERGIEAQVVEQVCLGRCVEGIAMRIAPGGRFFTEVEISDFDDILLALQAFEPADV
jgi:hypothetical protein